jgi:predicted nucleic-acid-binding Zn-ribbon protein
METAKMRDGQCPKCASQEVYFVEPSELQIPLGAFKAAPLSFYVCVNCGYAELYVKDSDLLPKIADQYMSVRELKEIEAEKRS